MPQTDSTAWYNAQVRKKKRRRRIRISRIALLVSIIILLVMLARMLFSEEQKTSSETPAAIPDPIWRNDYDWSSLREQDGHLKFEDEFYTSKFGIDVSFHQQEIDWQKVAADGVEFAFIRAGYRGYETGGLHTDDYFAANMDGASAAGIETDVYWFSQAVNTEEAEEEAAYVLNLISPYTVGTVAFDMETVSDHDRIRNLTAEEKTAIAAAFCRVIREAGYSVLVYGSDSWMYTSIHMEDLQEEVNFWLAGYGEDYPDFIYTFTIWQYSSTGKIDGIEKDCDLNLWLVPK